MWFRPPRNMKKKGKRDRRNWEFCQPPKLILEKWYLFQKRWGGILFSMGDWWKMLFVAQELNLFRIGGAVYLFVHPKKLSEMIQIELEASQTLRWKENLLIARWICRKSKTCIDDMWSFSNWIGIKILLIEWWIG